MPAGMTGPLVVEIRLLGFDVEVDGVRAPADGWRRRQAAAGEAAGAAPSAPCTASG